MRIKSAFVHIRFHKSLVTEYKVAISSRDCKLILTIYLFRPAAMLKQLTGILTYMVNTILQLQ